MNTVCFYISAFFISLVLKLVMRIKVKAKGTELLPRTGACLLICNHLSFLDPCVMAMVTPRALNFMARKDLFDIRLLGSWMRASGVIPLSRDKVDFKAIREAMRALKKGRVVTIFPEGTRQHSLEESFSNIKKGFLLLVKKSNVPIVVAKISGTEKAWSKSEKKIRRGTKIEVSFSEPFMIGKAYNYEEELERIKEIFAKL